MRAPTTILRWVLSLAVIGGVGRGVGIAAETGVAPVESGGWESTYQKRLEWWSLQPLTNPAAPVVRSSGWVRQELDRFVLAALEAKGLEPAPAADPVTLLRRLSFALTGLPPTQGEVVRFASDPSPRALEDVVDALLASPHFGERWARHWMDVVHYSDTHGYEWDTPAKNAWRYRDYLIRAFNDDVPFRQLILEQLAGDLIEPRVDSRTGINESLIGPMALRLGERRHGDNAAAEGVTQEAVANIIDTVGKGFLGTTVACAQCHDHKLDAVAQRDFYAWAGLFWNTRWGARSIDATDPNADRIRELHAVKGEIRRELGRLWGGSRANILERIAALPVGERGTESTNGKTQQGSPFPETLLAWWQRSQVAPVTRDAFRAEQERRRVENRANLKLVADFATDEGAPGWRWEGWGMHHGRARDGEFVVALEGDSALAQILPAGRWSHLWSPRLAGALRSPLLGDGRVAATWSLGMAGGQQAARSFIVDHAFHSERMQFLQQPEPKWVLLKTGAFDTLEGGLDQLPRRVYLELATKSLNNYFPPRTGYGGVKETELTDERSWFGVTRIYEHPEGHPPRDELGRFEALFADANENPSASPPTDVAGSTNANERARMQFAESLANLLGGAVERWTSGLADAETARLLDDGLRSGLLINRVQAGTTLAAAVERYRALERQLIPDRTVGSMADWNEAHDERIGVRGSYTQRGEEVPRGNIRFLGGAEARRVATSSGRLEWALNIASDRNPLTARVFVNRVWLHLFGEGLVRTPDDFGHLGEPPVHAALLDHLASRFQQEDWSLKKLVRRLVTSAVWRQSSRELPEAAAIDPENRLWHHHPMRRLEGEAIRDALLSVSGRLDPALYGPPVDPYRLAEDPAKRLWCGPLDGLGRRSLYLKMTLMEPPRFLALFNQPIPKLTVGKRDVTNVPDQALALLNDPLVLHLAERWGERVVVEDARAKSLEERVRRMFAAGLGREPSVEETARLVHFAQILAAQRALPSPAADPTPGEKGALPVVGPEALLGNPRVWREVAHAIFNLKEFIYVL